MSQEEQAHPLHLAQASLLAQALGLRRPDPLYKEKAGLLAKSPMQGTPPHSQPATGQSSATSG